MFKFERGDHVSFVYGSVFSPTKIGMFEAVVNGGKIISRKSSGSSGGPEYRVDGFTGWWPEENLVLVSRGPENLHCCEESSGAITYTPEETKCDTDENNAVWEKHNLDPWITYVCSNCCRTALSDPKGRSIASRFCPGCGKYMTNHLMEDDE